MLKNNQLIKNVQIKDIKHLISDIFHLGNHSMLGRLLARDQLWKMKEAARIYLSHNYNAMLENLSEVNKKKLIRYKYFTSLPFLAAGTGEHGPASSVELHECTSAETSAKETKDECFKGRHNSLSCHSLLWHTWAECSCHSWEGGLYDS